MMASQESGLRDCCAPSPLQPTRSDIVLRGYAFKHRGRYQAECVDLDIIVERDTLHEAFDALADAAEGYVRTASEQGWAEELIPRKAPFSRRLLYHLRTWPWRIKRSLADLELDRVVSFDNGHVRLA